MGLQVSAKNTRGLTRGIGHQYLTETGGSYRDTLSDTQMVSEVLLMVGVGLCWSLCLPMVHNLV